MSTQTLHVLHGLKLPSGSVTEITDHTAEPGNQNIKERATGFPWPQFISNVFTSPKISFSSPQLATLLALSGVGSAGLSGGNTDLEYRAVANLAERTAIATAAHARYRVTSALLVLNSITVQQSGVARAMYELAIQFDGTNPPMVPTSSVAVTLTPTSAEEFTLGPLYINTVQVPGVEEVTFETGLRAFLEASDGDRYPTFAAVESGDPMITATVKDITQISNLGLNGLTVASCSQYFRKQTANAGPLANGTNQHILIGGGAGLAQIVNVAGAGNSPVKPRLRVEFVEPTGTGNPMIVSLVAVIP